MAHSMFPNTGLQALSAAIHLIGVTILTFFISLRLAPGSGEDGTKSIFVRPTWPRLCVLLVLLDSWLFLFSSGLLIFGVGLQMNRTACAAGIYLCVVFYCTSKVLIYLFLTEKVYIVWNTGTRRLRSPIFLICIGSVTFYAAILLIMFFGRIHQFREGDSACVLGLKPTASIPLLSYDLYINLLLTVLFVYPLLRSKHSTAQMRRVALRTLTAATAALTTSTASWPPKLTLRCGADVILNAAALFWVTSNRGAQRPTISGSSGGVSGRHPTGTDSNNGAVHGLVSFSKSNGASGRTTSGVPANMFHMGEIGQGRTREFKARAFPRVFLRALIAHDETASNHHGNVTQSSDIDMVDVPKDAAI
ncbi:hypothetical protein MIND_00108800 [Mycena indigotica]|uniref:Uncharacterized protein n=1 Tax=Mycena indigotica TaxID=2126181 RepID=A0A8H6TEJ2_9AGAR|nr:uncharacterized protein MIND_00108800 [Mycena indigotica]KAF7315921.1 hypothetical protein MIND_00108800 [Mycena indigotica]